MSRIIRYLPRVEAMETRALLAHGAATTAWAVPWGPFDIGGKGVAPMTIAGHDAIGGTGWHGLQAAGHRQAGGHQSAGAAPRVAANPLANDSATAGRLGIRPMRLSPTVAAGSSAPRIHAASSGGGSYPPYASNDSYYDLHDRTLTVAAPGVLSNDSANGGSTLTATRVTGAAHGTVTLNGDGSFTYVPNYHYIGNDTFTYTASNSSGTSNVATVSLYVYDNTPSISGGSSQYDLHDHTLSVAAPGLRGNISDPDGDPFTVAITTQPAHGALTYNADGSYTYVPAYHYTGTDTFQYTASDGILTSSPATGSIYVYDGAPTISGGSSQYDLHDHTLSVAAPGLRGNISDPDGDPFTVAITTQPAHGALTYNADGSYTYVPAYHYTGTDTFQYTASDGILSTTATGSIYVYDNAPITSGESFTDWGDATLNIPASAGVLSVDSDPDSDQMTAVKIDSPMHGSVTLNSDGSFSYTPAPGYVGADRFTYKAFDGILYSALTTVTLNMPVPTLKEIVGGNGTDSILVPDPADPRHYTIPDGVPIGAGLNFSLGNLPDASKIQSFAWSGDRFDILSYFSTPGDQPAPPFMNVQGGVVVNQPTYKFFVNSTDPGTTLHYTVTITITYKPLNPGDQPGTDVVKADFDAIPPAVAEFTDIHKNNPRSDDQGGSIKVSLASQQPINTFDQVGFSIAANTTTAAKFGGHFMFLQTVRTYVTVRPKTLNAHRTGINERPAGNQPPPALPLNIDIADLTVTGYKSYTDPVHQVGGANEWLLARNTAGIKRTMSDSPEFSQADTFASIGIGKAGNSEQFFTFLMYKPEDQWNGIWVAMKEVDWNWGLTVTKNAAGGWDESNRVDSPPPQQTSAAGLFPKWDGRGPNALTASFVPDNP